uniref:Uncharacterized protein n=1 Tax=Escherichia phage Baskent_phicoli_1 TaxID=3145031 RepID=A0AAU8B8U3_9CAUD
MSIGHWVCLAPVISMIGYGIYDCIKRKSL